jgi:flagellar hook protein FlgE
MFPVTLDFTNLNGYAADNSIVSTGGDGYPTGDLVTFNVGSDGMITGVYSNGKQQPLGLLALASFNNPAGLQKVGDNMYLPTNNSGEFKMAVKAGTGSVGMLDPGALEMSNVDLSKEFTEMIVTQRAFQANSRIMTSVDEMLQDVVSMKR